MESFEMKIIIVSDPQSVKDGGDSLKKVDKQCEWSVFWSEIASH